MYSFRHLTHCLVLITVCYISVYLTSFVNDHLPRFWKWTPQSIPSHLAYMFVLALCNIGVIGRMYVTILNLAGLIFYECFPGPVQLKADLFKLPRISFRIVTRGDYPDLIAKNSNLIKSSCSRIGLKNFVVEIVTEKKLEIPDDNHVTQILVPQHYKTKRGTMFKARNLQYCLEDKVSPLSDQDWIVHLDEDSTLTTDALKGIANFVQEGKHKYGQGRISYDPDNITGTCTQILIAQRYAFDYGYSRVYGKALNKYPSFIKGSFIVCNVGAEKDVSFDGGPTASIMEFFYFTFNANRKGYRIGWVEGEMNELGALTALDFLTQYSRLSKGNTELEKNEIITGKLRLIYKINRFAFNSYFFYVVSLTLILFMGQITCYLAHVLFMDFGYQSGFLMILIRLNVAHDIYVGMFYLYKRYAILSWCKIIHFFTVNLLIGAFYYDLVVALSYILSWFKGSISFAVTKKTL